MKFKVKLNWHKCRKNKLKKIFVLKKKPTNEKNYKIFGKYYRCFYKCNKCDHMFAYHGFKISNIYNKTYLDLTYKDKKGLSKRFNQIINLPKQKSDNKNRVFRINKFFKNKLNILDIGSGTGVFLHEMKKKGHNVIGLDLDERYRKFLLKKKIKIYNSNLNKFKTKKKFDLITFNKVLEHVKDPLGMLKKSKKLLKKKGNIYVEVPNVKAQIKGKYSGEFCLDHLQIFSSKSLSQLMVKAGFNIVKINELVEPSNKYTIYGFFKN